MLQLAHRLQINHEQETRSAAMASPQGRILDLVKVCELPPPRLSQITFTKQESIVQAQCRIFSSTFNPQRLRLGNKVLRQRLRGPALASWYPRNTVSFRDLQDIYKPLDLETFDEGQDDREEAIQMYYRANTLRFCHAQC
jgi:hypothetical protein